jgi:hypothetical protein
VSNRCILVTCSYVRSQQYDQYISIIVSFGHIEGVGHTFINYLCLSHLCPTRRAIIILCVHCLPKTVIPDGSYLNILFKNIEYTSKYTKVPSY